MTEVRDVSGNFATAYAARPYFNSIVRPDGYLAYASDALDGARLRDALDRSFGL